MKGTTTDPKARALEDAQSAAANLLGEIAEDHTVMAAIRKASSETADDIAKVVREWKDAGESFLRSIGGEPPVTFLAGSVVVVSWKDGLEAARRGIVEESKPDEVTIRFEDDDEEDGYTFERCEGGWFEVNTSDVLVQIEQETTI